MKAQLIEEIKSHCQYSFARSGGKGGQHVNKTETKVLLIFHLESFDGFSEEEKERIEKKLKNRIDSEGKIQLVSQESRSQLKNKTKVTSRLIQLIKEALTNQKRRKPTSPSKKQKEERIKAKKIRASIKDTRKKPKL